MKQKYTTNSNYNFSMNEISQISTTSRIQEIKFKYLAVSIYPRYKWKKIIKMEVKI